MVRAKIAVARGVFLIPMLYVTWQRLRERSGEMFARKEKLQSSPAE